MKVHLCILVLRQRSHSSVGSHSVAAAATVEQRRWTVAEATLERITSWQLRILGDAGLEKIADAALKLLSGAAFVKLTNATLKRIASETLKMLGDAAVARPVNAPVDTQFGDTPRYGNISVEQTHSMAHPETLDAWLSDTLSARRRTHHSQGEVWTFLKSNTPGLVLSMPVGILAEAMGG